MHQLISFDELAARAAKRHQATARTLGIGSRRSPCRPFAKHGKYAKTMLRRSYSSRGASSEGKKSEAGNLQNHLSPAWTRLFKIIVALVDWVLHGPLAPAVLDIGTEVSRQVELFQQPRYCLAHVQLSIASPLSRHWAEASWHVKLFQQSFCGLAQRVVQLGFAPKTGSEGRSSPS